MEDIRQYIFSVIAASLLCAIVNTLLGKRGTIGAAIKMLTSLLVTITALSPLITLQLSNFSYFFEEINGNATAVAEEGSQMAKEASAVIIKQNTEAYILDKAASLGVTIEVEVKLDSTNMLIPELIYIQGNVSPYIKECLIQYIVNDLAIPEEKQIWI